MSIQTKYAELDSLKFSPEETSEFDGEFRRIEFEDYYRLYWLGFCQHHSHQSKNIYIYENRESISCAEMTDVISSYAKKYLMDKHKPEMISFNVWTIDQTEIGSHYVIYWGEKEHNFMTRLQKKENPRKGMYNFLHTLV